MHTDETPDLNQSMIAERELRLSNPDGSSVVVLVQIFAPIQEEHGEYSCRYKIIGLGKNVIEQRIHGIDGIQALQLCLRIIGARLSVARKKFDLTWLGTEEENLGFPTGE